MKDTILSVYKKQIVQLTFLVILSVTIWFVGPLLAIANQVPLAQPEKRFYIITALFLCWLLKFIFFDTAPKPKKNAKEISPDIVKKIQALQGRFQGALEFLKKTVINKQGIHFNLDNLPWFLLIGPADSGKTTLLANANINYILAKQFKSESSATKTPSSDTCDWWVTRDQVIVDVPGNYFTEKEKTGKNPEPHSFNRILWETFLNLVKTTPHEEKLHGIVIALNLPELMKKPNAQQKTLLVHNLKKRITELRAQFGSHLLFHIVITKCDLLPGFSEFFSESGSDELSQTWGITVPPLKAKEKLLDVISHRFNALIKRINKQLIWRLHQERSPNARPFIKDFPLHVERLKENIVTLLKTLALPDLQLCGIYFTSSTQAVQTESANYTHTAASQTTHQGLQIMRVPAMPTRTYFVRQLILQGLLHSSDRNQVITQHNYYWQRRAVYATAIGIIVTAALLLGHDFQQGIQKAYSIQNDLARYQLYIQQANQNPNGDRLVKALPLLDALQEVTTNSNRHLSRLENILSFYSNRSQQTALAVYHQALQTIVIPEIKSDLEKYLQTASNKNPVLVYTALKAYLMLADAANRQAPFIANTLNKITVTPMNQQAIHQLESHINAVFSGNAVISMELDQNLIAQVRKQLINLPSTELGFVILKNIDANNADSTIGLGTNLGNPPVFVSKQVTNHIPNMFTAENFQKIILEEVTLSANEALKGNWVLGNITPSLNQPSLDSLTIQLRNQYLENYVDIWESQLANIQPYTPKSLLQVDEMIQNLTSNNSPLLQLLQTIKQNTSFAPINTSSPKIQALDDLVTSSNSSQQIPLYQVFVNLRQLHVYLQTILTTSNMSQAAFSAAAQRMQTPGLNPITNIHQLADQSPEPLKTWLNTIADQSWDFVLQEAGQYVENAWQSDVIPTYNEQIANRYPFNQSSNQEVSLQQFSGFLGHRGILAKFYQTYLKNFINDTGTQWTWKTIDGKRIPFSNNLLAGLQHAAQIQRAFFPNGDSRLLVSFTLQPISLDTGMRSMILNINGQEVNYQKNSPRVAKILTWPGNNNLTHETKINFVMPKNQLVSNVSKGDWGWFKIVANATQNVNSRKEILLNLAVNGHSAKYLLFTEGHMNPFLPMNMSRFDLPQVIID